MFKKESEDFLKEVKEALQGVNTNGKYVAFWGTCFSNFFPTHFYLDNKRWTTSEKYFMYMKAKIFNDEEIANKILKLDDPKEIRNLGRKVKNFSEEIWDKVKYNIMYNAVNAKFTQDALCNSCIKEFPTQIFVEGSPIDKIWGVGIIYYDDNIFDEKNWKGENLLGKILTKVRDEIFEDALNSLND